MTPEIFPTKPECESLVPELSMPPESLFFQLGLTPIISKIGGDRPGFTNTFNEFDFRVGGKWSFVMHGPDKGNYPNECEFIKIEKPSLVAWKRYSKPLFQVVFTFEEITGNKTKIVFRMIFDTPEECNKLRPFVVDKNEENFDRLEKELIKMVL